MVQYIISDSEVLITSGTSSGSQRQNTGSCEPTNGHGYGYLSLVSKRFLGVATNTSAQVVATLDLQRKVVGDRLKLASGKMNISFCN